MPKIFPKSHRDLINDLSLNGMSYVQIAKEMSARFPQDWNNKSAVRTIGRILKEYKKSGSGPEQSAKTLDEMTREERFKHIESKLQNTARFRMTFRNFSTHDKDVFIDEYLHVVRSTETLTEVEEQQLFAAILELILALQALNRKEQEEKWRDESLNGKISMGDPRFRPSVDDKYQKEYDQHMKLYQKGMEGLKMSRSQRLHEVRSQKQTLVDLAEELSNKNVQSEVAEEIERLSKLKDQELKRLLELGHLHGTFENF